MSVPATTAGTCAPDGEALTPSVRPRRTARWSRRSRGAWRWRKLLDAGVYTSVSEIAEAERIGKSYVSRILRLALLAPDVVEGMVEGRADPALMLERLERPLPSQWADQRRVVLGGGTTPRSVLA